MSRRNHQSRRSGGSTNSSADTSSTYGSRRSGSTYSSSAASSAPPPYTSYDESGHQDTSHGYGAIGGAPYSETVRIVIHEQSPLNSDFHRYGYTTLRQDVSSGRPLKCSDKTQRASVWVWLGVICLIFVMLIFVALFAVQYVRAERLSRHLAAYPPTRAELDRLEQEWRSERDAFKQDKGIWADGRRAFEEDRRRWLVELREHERLGEQWRRDEEQQELEWKDKNEHREREWKEAGDAHHASEGKRLGLAWDRVERHQCVRYGVREYTARLAIDMSQACRRMPIEADFDGIAIDVPHDCDVSWERPVVLGHWQMDTDEAGCKPYWGQFYRKGCSAHGKRRYEARLWGLNHGEDWYAMCGTTPVEMNGQHLDHPAHCENRGIFYGMVGMWDVDDRYCY